MPAPLPAQTLIAIPSSVSESLDLPAPGAMVDPSPAYVPVLVKGICTDASDLLRFDLVVDTGDTGFTRQQVRREMSRIIEYFLAALTIPRSDLWVNLSPDEAERIVPDALGMTQLGRDMLAQDYILKQLTASLMHPDRSPGKEYWQGVYAPLDSKASTGPVDTFTRVWIMPASAVVYEQDGKAVIVESRLKVMLDEEYRAQKGMAAAPGVSRHCRLFRELILPGIEKEVNEGRNFARIRQLYQCMILAMWYKETVIRGPLSESYADQRKIQGIDSVSAEIKDRIHARYVEAFTSGVFNVTRKEFRAVTQSFVERSYASGGEEFTDIPLQRTTDPAAIGPAAGQYTLVSVGLKPVEARDGGHHLSDAELELLRGPDEAAGFIAKRAFDEQRVRAQVEQIETALARGKDIPQERLLRRAEEIAAWARENQGTFKKEEVHVLDGVGSDARVIGRVDRGIAEAFGYVHETANIVLVAPDGNVLLQLRNKRNFDDHLAMYGGHLTVGESHFTAVGQETLQETGLDALQSEPVFAGYEGYDVEGDANRERRSWFVKVLTPQEYEKFEARDRELGRLKRAMDRESVKRELFRQQDEKGDGSGEVLGVYRFSVEQIMGAPVRTYHDAPFQGSKVRSLRVSEEFAGETVTVDAFFTPDALDHLVSSGALWTRIRQMTGRDGGSQGPGAGDPVGGIDMSGLEVSRGGPGPAAGRGAGDRLRPGGVPCAGYTPVIVDMAPLENISQTLR